MPHRMHTGGRIALTVNWLLIGGLSVFPQTRPAALIVALIPDVVIYGAGMALARDWGHSGKTPLDEQVFQGMKNLGSQYCDAEDPPWWC